MAKVIGLVNLHANVDYKGLTERRPAASVSFLGRYGIIDFALSNFSNSGIDSVGVLIKEKPRSLFKHMGLGNSWNFNSKSGGISLLYNEKYANNPHYNHDINNMIENKYFFNKTKADYVVIAPTHIITTLNYSEVVEAHEKSGSKITMVYKNIDDADKSFIGEKYVSVKNNKIIEVVVNKGNRKKRCMSLSTYVINLDYLMKLMKKSSSVSAFFDLSDILGYLCDEADIAAYEYRGYATCLNSLEAYYKHSLEFLDIEIFSTVFKSNWPIYTNTKDTPPSKYKANAKVKKGFVANGAIVDGHVENSIIGRDVVIGTGAVVKNSILLSGSVVGPGAVLENVILDKDSKVEVSKSLTGTSIEPLYVKEGDVV